jgi:hypothetical protein
MSAESAVRAGLAAALRGDAELVGQLNGVFDGPQVRASPPFAQIGDMTSIDWGTKDRRGREVRAAVLVRDLAKSPERLGALVDAAERAIEAMPAPLDGWRTASCALLRSRMAGAGPGKWLAVIEYRVRVLEED